MVTPVGVCLIKRVLRHRSPCQTNVEKASSTLSCPGIWRMIGSRSHAACFSQTCVGGAPRWTAEEGLQLASFVKAGLSYADIARQMPHRNVSAVQRHCRDLGHTQRRRRRKQWTGEEVAQLLHDRDSEHLDWAAIGQKHGRTAYAVHEKYVNVVPVGQRTRVGYLWDHEQDQTLVKLRKADRSVEEISREVGRVPSMVRARLLSIETKGRGRPQKPDSVAIRQVAPKLLAQGRTWKQIASIFPGQTDTTIRSAFHRTSTGGRAEATIRVAPHIRNGLTAREQTAIDLRNEGFTFGEIAVKHPESSHESHAQAYYRAVRKTSNKHGGQDNRIGKKTTQTSSSPAGVSSTLPIPD